MAGTSAKKSKLVLRFGNGTKDKVICTWMEATASLVLRLIDVCNDVGCAPSFSITMDGGAYRVYFLHDQLDKSERSQYLPGNQDLDEWLRELIEFWEGVRDMQNGPKT